MTGLRKFELYPEERHWWSFNDYGAVLDLMLEHQAKRVLEFGPGSSTLALIEGGAEHIDTCEDDPDWAATYEDRLVKRFPAIVHLHRYEARLAAGGDKPQPRISIPAIDKSTYDLALIDGPHDTEMRVPSLNYALRRAAVVVLADDYGPNLRARLDQLLKKRSHVLERRETGPLAGAFTIIRWAA
jgi:hypothetical protein